MSTTERGIFITFEGVDGSGKTTQMHQFAARLQAQGRNVVITVEPGGTEIGRRIRAILLDPVHDRMSPVAELLLYFAARAQNVDECIEPALRAGSVVLADRYTDSTLAYQGVGRGLGREVVEALHKVACRGRDPEITFYIDVPVSVSLGRVRERNSGTANRMDEQPEEFYQRVRDGYEWLAAADPQRVRRIDGAGTVDEVAARVWAEWERLARV